MSYQGIDTETICFYSNSLANAGNYISQNVGSNAGINFNFFIPPNFVSLVSANVYAYANTAGAVGAGKNITLNSNFAAPGLLRTANALTQAQSITIPALNQIYTISANGVLTGIASGQVGGLNITHNTIGGSVGYLYLALTFIRK